MNREFVRRHRWLLASLLAGLLIRLAWLTLAAPSGLQGDENAYMGLVRSLLAGDGYRSNGVHVTNYMPGWPLLLSLPFALGGGVFTARLMIVILSTLIALQAYLLGQALVSRRAGLYAAWAAALFPPLVWYSALLLSETASAVMFGLWALAAVRYVQRETTWLRVVTLGLFSGLLVLFRAEMVVVLPLPFLCRLLALGVKQGFVKQLARGAVAGALAAVVLLPWVVYNHHRFGETMVLTSAFGASLWIVSHDPPLQTLDDTAEVPAHLPPDARARLIYEQGLIHKAIAELWVTGRPKATDRRFAAAARAQIRARPAAYFKGRLRDLPRFWLGSHAEVLPQAQRSIAEAWRIGDRTTVVYKALGFASQAALALLSLLGLWLFGRRREMLLPLLIVLAKAAIHAPFTQTTRYSLTLAPLLFCYAAAALVWALDRVRVASSRRVVSEAHTSG